MISYERYCTSCSRDVNCREERVERESSRTTTWGRIIMYVLLKLFCPFCGNLLDTEHLGDDAP